MTRLACSSSISARRRCSSVAYSCRRLLAAALEGTLSRADFRRDPYFGFAVPTSVPGVEPHILYPVKTWQDKAAFAETAKRLVAMFEENFKRFEAHVDHDVKSAAPKNQMAA